MVDSSMQINALIVDATDPERLAAFWSELLGGPFEPDDEGRAN
ncbi:hypothetical protein Shyhy01_38300 [Streptomyces hygroscopicus subsp. hygroscopicus]|nr:VOC family protein [Streptomyces hygroscopicus]GLX50880.1 hypothetical protein Shyhy01_38300 [Streptomyces hygroscopicus subsp. hygroscopicus]